MSEATGAPWSSEQLSWLQALGHVVYLDRDSVVAEAQRTLETDVPVAVATPVERAMPRREPATTRVAPVAPAAAMPEAHAVPPPSRRGAGPRLPDRLQLALLRASGCNPNDPGTRALMEAWPLAELRANPAAKRALWPQLRALRKRRQ